MMIAPISLLGLGCTVGLDYVLDDTEPLDDTGIALEDPIEETNTLESDQQEEPVEEEAEDQPVEEELIEEEELVEEEINGEEEEEEEEEELEEEEEPVEPIVEEPDTWDGLYETNDGFTMDLRVFSDDDPTGDSDRCIGDVALTITDDVLTADGFCLQQTYSNAWSYVLEGTISNDSVEGTLAFTYNGLDFEVLVGGTIDEGLVTLDFADLLTYHAGLGIYIDIEGDLVAEQ